MTPTEAAALLTICAGFDNRKPDADVAKAWSIALDGYRFEDCRAAVVTHYVSSRDWIMPADIIAAVKRIRSKRIAEGEGQLVPPEGCREGAALHTWLRSAKRRLGDGEPVDQVSPAEIGTKRDMRELGAAKSVDTALAARTLREAHEEAVRVLQEAAAVDKAERAERRAELDRMRETDRVAVIANTRRALTTQPEESDHV